MKYTRFSYGLLPFHYITSKALLQRPRHGLNNVKLREEYRDDGHDKEIEDETPTKSRGYPREEQKVTPDDKQNPRTQTDLPDPLVYRRLRTNQQAGRLRAMRAHPNRLEAHTGDGASIRKL